MAFWEYTLTGFGDFLEQRSVAFTEPMPASRVCSICGRVPSSSVLLACCHVVCDDCRGETFEEMVCPYDGRASTKGQLVPLRFELSDLEELRVACMVGGRRCATFAGTLSELRDHLRHCSSGDVKCAKCYRSIAREAAVDHYRQCSDGNAPRHSVINASVQRAIERIRGIREDLERLGQRTSNERDGDDNLVNGLNGFREILASVDRLLSEAQEMVSGVDRKNVPFPSSMKPPTPGPFRAPSKHGMFIATFKFTNVFAARNRLTQTTKEHAVWSQTKLCGYTLRLCCQYLLGGENSEDVKVKFHLGVRYGAWNDFLDWLFSKKVAVLIAHPRDQTKDVRLRACLHSFAKLKMPPPSLTDSACSTEMSWKLIDLEDYVTKGVLYIHVEFE